MKQIFHKLSVSDLIKQITIVALFLALGVVFQQILDIHVGPFHIFSATIISSFLIATFVDWRVSIVGSMTMITLGELIITPHQEFWTNYLPMFIAIVIISLMKIFRSFWLTMIAIFISIIQFEMFKALIIYLTYGPAMGYAFFVGGLIQVGTGSVIILLFYTSLYKVIKIANSTFYSYS